MASVLTPAQAAAVEHRGGALLIAAAAGSGKTRVLVERLMARITGPDAPDIDDFLIITFTRAAASELRERISSELTSRLAKAPSDRWLRRQLALVSRARICTIDSFCAGLVRSYAHVLDIRPDFRIPDQRETELIRARVLSALLDERYENMTPGFKRLADVMGAGRDDGMLEQTVAETYAAVQAHAYPERWIAKQLEAPSEHTDVSDTLWGAELINAAKRTVSAQLRAMEWARSGLYGLPEADKAYGDSFKATAESLRAFLRALEKGWDAALAFGEPAFPRLKALKAEFKEAPEVAAALRIRDRCRKAMGDAAALFDASSQEHLAEMAATRPVTDELLRLVLDYDAALTAEKKRRAVLDYGDLEHLTLRLLLDDEGRPTERAAEVSSRFTEILVDEYQDVSGVQDMIFGAVSKNGENLVLVGDVKQSIYRFRLADPSIFLQKYNSWPDEPLPGGPRRILLSQNFRSRTGVLEAVNRLFSDIMSPELGEMEYGEREALVGGGSFPETEEPPFELDLLDMPKAPEELDRTAAEAAFAARRIRELLDSGMEVEGRTLAPGDIAVLMRSLKGKAEAFAAALRKAGVPASAQKSGGAPEDGEVATALAYLSIIDNPRQDVALIAVLRSALFGFTADELAAIRAAAKEVDFYTALTVRAQSDEKCNQFLSALLRYREAAPELGVERLLRLIYDESGLLATCGDSGRLYALLEAARAFEARGGGGLYGFVSELRDLEEAGEPFTLPSVKTGGGEVTVGSIHSSKGLEWPVVLVAGLSGKFNTADEKRPLLIHRELGVGPYSVDLERRIRYPTLARTAIKSRLRNETLSEEMRLLYVAMTRAKEKLILITAPRNGAEAWEQIYEAQEEPEAAVLERCGSMADWILLCAAKHAGESPCWQPRIVTPEQGPESDEDVRETPEPDRALAELIRERISFTPTEPEAWRLPSKLTATELKGGTLEAEAAEGAENYIKADAPSLRRPVFESEKGRLTPSERGTALHKAVQFADISLCETAEGAASELARLRELRLITPAEADSVMLRQLTALALSPLGQRMRAASELRREFKFSLLMPAGELIDGGGDDELLLQGVVDCLFREGEGLVVVDFKSDAVTTMTQKHRAARYAPQLGAYGKAMERIFKRPVTEKLIYFFQTGETVKI